MDSFGCDWDVAGCGGADSFISADPAWSGTTCDDLSFSCDWTCGPPSYNEICNNGVDDDNNGLIDCDDPACRAAS